MKTQFFRVRRSYLAAACGLTAASAVTAATLFQSAAAPMAWDAGDQRVTQALKRSLQKRVSSPGGKLNLAVHPTSRAGEGYFSEIVIAGRPAKVKKLTISELNLRARNVRIDVPYLLQSGEVRTLQSTTTLRAVVTENDLTALLAKGKRTKALGLRVKYISGNRLLVTGNLNWTLINGPIVGIARLRLIPGSKVNLDVLSLKLRGAEVPQLVKNQFSSRLNPIIDYEDMPFRPRFKGLRIQGTKATLSA